MKKIIQMNDKRKIYKALNGKTPIFIYQMGKVASSSIYHSLQEFFNYNGTVFHAHHFESPHSYNPRVGLFYDYYFKVKPHIKIITLTREPIGTNISRFFQNIKFYADIDKIKNNEYKAKELQEIFFLNENHNLPLTWFDEQLKYNFNIDIFEYEFPKKHYMIINKDCIDLLIMHHDLDDNEKEKAIMEFLSISSFKLKRANDGEKKFYQKAYQEMKNLTYPKWYIDEMLNSKYANHFYKDDIDTIALKWQHK